ncbi:MAG: hypothetical protein IJ167_04060 [Lachnospiraceae bacterium]|nr:hypothetical protein [Lachnospiraceae bacterium]
MKVIVNFIAAVFFIEVGFFLLFGNNINMDEMSKNLNNYQDGNIPVVGTTVEIYIVDIGELFLKNENYTGMLYEEDCYYLAQINDGRFIVIKTSEGSVIDEQVSEFSEKCRDFYFLKKGEKPPILSLEGKIEKTPYLDDAEYEVVLDDAARKFMPTRGYVRMDVSDIIINVDLNVGGKSMDGVLQQSIKIMVSVANTLKKFLGAIVILIGVVLVISFIKDVLGGITFGGNQHVIVAGDEVFKNISVMKNATQEDSDTILYEEAFDKGTEDKSDNDNTAKTLDKKEKKHNSGKGFRLKKEE